MQSIKPAMKTRRRILFRFTRAITFAPAKCLSDSFTPKLNIFQIKRDFSRESEFRRFKPFALVALEYFATFRCNEKTNTKINALSKIKRARDIFRRKETTLFTHTQMIISLILALIAFEYIIVLFR